ncbi:hypothetical protein BGZ76_005057 [Entomortierella beljakovae]|nr:hypothetical protein BGZ76_005057 [Entomortierella beljakovae]
MTAIHATESSLLASSNGHDHPHDHILIHNGRFNGKAPSVTFAQDEFTQLTLYTGNTIATGTTGLLNTTLKKSNQELVSAVQDTLYNTLNSAQVNNGHITVADQASLGPLESDRSKYDITVKLFFISPAGVSNTLSVDQLNLALDNLDVALGSTEIVIDNFILSLPNQSFDENGLDDAELDVFRNDIHQLYLPVWQRLSDLRKSGRITRLGVAEFSRQQLEILKTVAESEGASSPEIDQVNLDDCCVLPKDLINYAKAEGIELLTHGDATNILPKSTLASLLQPHLPAASNSTLTPNFVLKYSALLTGRGLIERKGYAYCTFVVVTSMGPT